MAKTPHAPDPEIESLKSKNLRKGLDEYKHGGKVKRTGRAVVHKGELVLKHRFSNRGARR